MPRTSTRTAAAVAVLTTLSTAAPVVASAQHDHGGANHAGKPVDCRSLATPPWSGLPASDLDAIKQLQTAISAVRSTDSAAQSGFAPQFGDIPTMGVHWVNGGRMRDAVRVDQPDHLLFTRIAGRDSLVGVAYAFRGPVDAAIPATFASPLAQWHDHANLGGGAGQTLHMLHVWFVPSPYGPFAGNNFFLPLMSAGMSLPNPCWIQTDGEVERLEMIASLVDLVNRQRDSTRAVAGQGMIGRRRGGAALDAFSDRATASLVALEAAAKQGDRVAWERAADQGLNGLSPIERRLLTAFRDRVKGIQASTRR